MASPAQATANLANAQHSTGPRTDAGKAASSHNALKHGLTAQTTLLPGEDEAAYQKLCADTLAYYGAAGAHEVNLIQILCDTQWRISRCARLEAAALSGEVPDLKALETISRHGARLKKQHSTLLSEIATLVNSRIERRNASLKDCVTIRRADKIKRRQTDLAAIGFDLPEHLIQRVIAREDALTRAENAIIDHDTDERAREFSLSII
jgi:hypothetical protein